MTGPGPSSRNRRPTRKRAPRAEPADWSPVWSGQELDASIVAGSLESSGFETRALPSSSVSPAHLGTIVGRSTVYVRAHEAPRARRLLAERGEGANVVEAAPPNHIEDNWRMITRLAIPTAAAVLAIALYLALRDL